MSDAPFVAHLSRAKVLGYVLFLLAGAGAVVAIAATSFNVASAGPYDWVILALSVMVVLMFVYGVFRIGGLLSYRGDVIAIDADGIRLPRLYQGTLPWSSMARAEVVKGGLQLWLAKDADIPPGKGLDHILRTNQALRGERDGADMRVTTWLTHGRNDELIEAVRARAPQLFA